MQMERDVHRQNATGWRERCYTTVFGGDDDDDEFNDEQSLLVVVTFRLVLVGC